MGPNSVNRQNDDILVDLAREWQTGGGAVTASRDDLIRIFGVITDISTEVEVQQRVQALLEAAGDDRWSATAWAQDAEQYLLALSQPGVIGAIWSAGNANIPSVGVREAIAYKYEDVADQVFDRNRHNPLGIIGMAAHNREEMANVITALRAQDPATLDEVRDHAERKIYKLEGYAALESAGSPQRAALDRYIQRVRDAQDFLLTDPVNAATAVENRMNAALSLERAIARSDTDEAGFLRALGFGVNFNASANPTATYQQFIAALASRKDELSDLEYIGTSDRDHTKITGRLRDWERDFVRTPVTPAVEGAVVTKIEEAQREVARRIQGEMQELQQRASSSHPYFRELQMFGFQEPVNVRPEQVRDTYNADRKLLENSFTHDLYGAQFCRDLLAALTEARNTVLKVQPAPGVPAGTPIDQPDAYTLITDPNRNNIPILSSLFQQGGARYEANRQQMEGSYGDRARKEFERQREADVQKEWHQKQREVLLPLVKIGGFCLLAATATVIYVGVTGGIHGLEALLPLGKGFFGEGVASALAQFLGPSLAAVGGFVGWCLNKYVTSEDTALGNQFRALQDESLDVREIAPRVRSIVNYQVAHALSFGNPETDPRRREAIMETFLETYQAFQRMSPDQASGAIDPDVSNYRDMMKSKLKWLTLGIEGPDLKTYSQNAITEDEAKKLLMNEPRFLLKIAEVDPRLVAGLESGFVHGVIAQLSDPDGKVRLAPADAQKLTDSLTPYLDRNARDTRNSTRHSYNWRILNLFHPDRRIMTENEDIWRTMELCTLVLTHEGSLQEGATPTDQASIKGIMLKECKQVEDVYMGRKGAGGGQGMHIPEKRLLSEAPVMFYLGKLFGVWRGLSKQG